MATVHMTIDPTATHMVINLTREKLWDGDVKGIEDFFKEGFGIDDPKIISRIVRGEYIMVFNPDGSGNLVPRDEVTKKQEKAMGGLPEYLDRRKLIDKLRLKIKSHKDEVEELYKLQSLRDFHNIHKEYDIYLNTESYRILNPVVADSGIEFEANATVTVGSLLKLFARSKQDANARDLVDTIKHSNSKASEVLLICSELEKQIENYKKISAILSYVEKYWEKDIMELDRPKIDGLSGIDSEDLLAKKGNSQYYYILVPYQRMMVNAMQDYQYIFAKYDEQKAYSGEFVGREIQIEREMKAYADFYNERKQCKNDPVDINANRWDAGWISPEGKVWAANGSTANLIHINLAKDIFEYMGWDDVQNKDLELEKRGWLKFHNRQVAFTGYSMTNIEGRHKLTERQKDRLIEYAKVMGYKRFDVGFTGKSFQVNEIFTLTNEEWTDIFEW